MSELRYNRQGKETSKGPKKWEEKQKNKHSGEPIKMLSRM
jgi:hypothetical protein